jgi:hypothetical protein
VEALTIESDAIARRVLDIFSLAEGRWLNWGVRRIWIDQRLFDQLFVGTDRSSKPHFEAFTYLNYQPILDLALTQYSEAVRRSSGVDVAIEWAVSNPRYAEAEIVALFTAIEHLIYVHQSQSDRGNLPKKAFSRYFKSHLKRAVNDLIANARADSIQVTKEQQTHLMNGVAQLNRPHFKAALAALISDHDVPMQGIQQDIPALVALRNDIVHKGICVNAGVNQPLSFYAGVARELFVRIVLSILGFRGSYMSYVAGPRLTQFPEIVELN